jgi:RimJ/RimL family protein N-acetyltransferase
MNTATPVLEGSRVRLEPLTADHLPGLEQVAFDPRIWRYTLQPVETHDDLLAWFETAKRLETAGTGMPWVTVLKESGQAIGSTRFIDLDWKHRTVEIGHTWLHPAMQGSGVNPEAKLLQLSYAFDTLGMRRVALKTHHENLPSQAALRKLGAVYEGTFRNHFIMPDGSARHSVWFAITREDWPEVRSRLEARVAAERPSPPSA